MKFVLFVEGYTERIAVPQFLKRWLDPRLPQPVGIQAVRFDGWAELVDDVARKAHMHLNGPHSSEVIAVISLLDLYGPTFYPTGVDSAPDRLRWAVDHLQKKVQHERFRQFFAVHETEAWLLSQPELFQAKICDSLYKKAKVPEDVNFDEPPAFLLDQLYRKVTGRSYKKVTYGRDLFGQLDPAVAYAKCPNLKALLDEMLMMARVMGV